MAETLTLKDIEAQREKYQKDLGVAQRMFVEAQQVIGRCQGALGVLASMEQQMSSKKNGKKTKKDKRK